MEQLTIQLSNEAYQRLLEQSALRKTTPSNLAEHLLGEAIADFLPDEEDYEYLYRESTDEEAQAAWQRLTTLFADIKIDPERLEEIINDPMNQMINAYLNYNDKNAE